MAYTVQKQFRGKDLSGVKDFAPGDEVIISCPDLLSVALREGWVVPVSPALPDAEDTETESTETNIFEDFAKKKKTKK